MEEAVLTPDEKENLVDVFRTLKNWREKRSERQMLQECESVETDADSSAEIEENDEF